MPLMNVDEAGAAICADGALEARRAGIKTSGVQTALCACVPLCPRWGPRVFGPSAVPFLPPSM